MTPEKGFLDSWFTFISIMLACLLLAIIFAQGSQMLTSGATQPESHVYGTLETGRH